jgi:glycerophosphoryl diester phosphodiesterase
LPVTGLIFAHRGSPRGSRDNTLDAFRAAIEAGADGLELDVHTTRDGRFVVHHDDAIDGALIAAMTADNAHQLARTAGYELPELADVIELARGRVRLDVELKAAGCERAVVKLFSDHGLSAADVIVTSFNAKVVARVVEFDADVLTGLLVEQATAADAIDTYFECGADVLAPRHDMVNGEFLREMEREEVVLLPWTVNDPGSMRWLFRAPSVLGIITDRVAEAVRVRAEAPSA